MKGSSASFINLAVYSSRHAMMPARKDRKWWAVLDRYIFMTVLKGPTSMKIVNQPYSKVKCNFIWKKCFYFSLLYSTLLTLDYGKWREHSKSWNSYCNSSIIYQGRKEILLHSDFIWTTKPTSYIFYQGRFVVHKVQILWEDTKIEKKIVVYFVIT